MSAADLTDRDLAALGIWCAYESAGHGADQCYPYDYRGLTDEQRTAVLDAQYAAIEGITDVLAAMYGCGWSERIKAIEDAAHTKDADR